MNIEPILNDVIQYVIDNPEQSATVVAAVIGVVANYLKTGKFPIGRLPYQVMRESIREYGDRYFGRKRPKGVPALLVDVDADTIEAALRPRHYESGDLTSYEYADEVLNLRRPRGWMSDPKTGRDVPMETHVRTFDVDGGGSLLLVHDEANRYEATGEHLSPGLYSWERGRDIAEEDLEDAGIDVQRIESERRADVDVLPN